MPQDDRCRACCDERVITDVLVAYATALDRGDGAAIAECFSTDAWFCSARGTAHGREAIVNQVSQVTTMHAVMHFVGNVSIDVRDDSADVNSYTIAYLIDRPDGTVRVRGLRYQDRFVRDGGGRWRIAERRHAAMWMFGAQALPPVPAPDALHRPL